MKNESKYYPSWVYCSRVDVTIENKKQYDKTKEIFDKKCEELAPNYWSLPLRERMKVRDKAEEILGYRR